MSKGDRARTRTSGINSEYTAVVSMVEVAMLHSMEYSTSMMLGGMPP